MKSRTPIASTIPVEGGYTGTMKRLLLLLAFAVSTVATAAEPLKLSHHDSTLVPTPGAIHEMLVVDPRVVSVVPLSNNQFHIQAIGPGETDVTANFVDGSSTTYTVEVAKKRHSGKPDFQFSRGRAILLTLPSPATYVGIGDPNLVNVTHLEGHQRYFLVGLNDGKTNLLVVSPNGLQESTIEVGKTTDDTARTALKLDQGAETLQIIGQRPTNLVVANKQIAGASLQKTKDGQYGLTVSGLNPGTTDILVSLGLNLRPVWYTVTVE